MRPPETSARVLAFALFFMIAASVCADSRAPLVAYQAARQSVTKSKRLRMLASTRKGETEHSLVLEWYLKNVSREDVNFRDTHILRDYSIIITDREGHPVQPTEKGQNIIFASGWVSHRDLVTLHPGEQVKKQIVITEIYNFRPREIYTIQVERKISFDKGKTFEQVRSNIVRMRVEG
jgi:hypothetical protein